MPVEMIGWIAPRVSSELIPPAGPPFDAKVIAETARIHERAGFDRVLIGYFSDAPDGFLVGAHAASVTERLGFLLAHRPGFVAPPVAARKLATLDQLSDGRLAVHIIAGGSDADQAKDGDWTDHEARYRRSAEYVSLLRRTWTAPAPFDHEGEFYRTRGTAVKQAFRSRLAAGGLSQHRGISSAPCHAAGMSGARRSRRLGRDPAESRLGAYRSRGCFRYMIHVPPPALSWRHGRNSAVRRGGRVLVLVNSLQKQEVIRVDRATAGNSVEQRRPITAPARGLLR